MIRSIALFTSLSTLSSIAAVPVTDDDMVMATQSYGELRRDASVDGKPLVLAGKTYSSGLGSHATSEIPVSVPEGTSRFTGAVGVDDAAGVGKGSVKFRILSGNAVLWESPRMKAGDAPAAFDIPVSSALHRKLYLQADDLEDRDFDHADWVDLAWVTGEGIAAKKAEVLDGAAFGLKPGVQDDQTAAMRKAVQALREAPGSTLKLAKGEYHFHATGALQRHFHISNHEQPEWHPVSIPLVDLQGATLDGQGSTFIFHGDLQPMLIQDSVKVTVKGIGIDYSIPHHSQGVITKVEGDAYELDVDQKKFPHEIRSGWFFFTGEGWGRADAGIGIIFDGKTRNIVAGTSDYTYKGPLTELSPGHYRIAKNIGKDGIKAGDVITFRQNIWVSRPHPAVTLYRAKDTTLDHVAIHSSQGMGVLAQRSENIRLTGGGVFPRKETGRYFSTNADATHFSNCKGEVIAENGLYEGMMDDAINVHATCLRIEEKVDARTLRCKFIHNQAFGFETFLPGETLQFIQAKWLTPRDPRKVVSVRRTGEDSLIITLDSDVPADLGKGDAVENVDWFPAVVFRGNLVHKNRARGSLFTTPKPVLVENNRFEDIAGSAILLAGDANGWYESGACHDVVIRKNIFKDNLTSRFQFTEGLISCYPELPDLKGQTEYYHRNVKIEDNTFETFDVPLLFAISTQGITFRGNKVAYNDKFPSWKKAPFILNRCDQVDISNNTVTRGGKPVKWSATDVKTNLCPPDAVKVK
ncbi:NPCBM/NEW2 domain-containing protein [Luteolibacter ambystomatis]|uniref:NPCBM/NEW2 domain-containing protein n=1 Tax=Luteolibacter ambystomatis TaxID=2824561 RepID=A0A975J0H1_9BACT|nr:NPCBM/NEW2 domain-containing protein [Luteolibacter ambystomatis]QUE51756.1 NPCBM/NEW2 domain-containing protein [Luteolibacter ambystomatis]